MLQRALASVSAQGHPAAAVSVAVDNRREGAAVTRQRALDAVRTPWVAFLDDDDEFKPNHLGVLLRAAKVHEADYVFSWFDTVPIGRDPFPKHAQRAWDNARPFQTTITVLVRTELAQSVGFHNRGSTRGYGNEDWHFTLGCMKAGGKIHHEIGPKTWRWHHHGKNLSGLPKW